MSGYVWTPEQRRRKSEAIHRWKPWTKTRGPVTPAGKARCCMNSYRGGARTKAAAMATALRELSRRLDDMQK